MKQFVLGVTGASGAGYARRLAQALARPDLHLHLVVSPAGRRVMTDELGLREFTVESILGSGADNITIHPHQDIGASIASGSFVTAGMAICPCSGNTLSAIAAGLADNLITRAAAVTLKEGRKLVLVPRETPLGQIEIKNMLRLSRAGAVICPASPGFYAKPTSIDDLIDFVAARVLDLFELPHTLGSRWTGEALERAVKRVSEGGAGVSPV